MLKKFLALFDEPEPKAPAITSEVLIRERHIPAAPAISITDAPEDCPSFHRYYKGVLTNNARIELDAKYLLFKSRYWSGILIQPNGNRVYFDPLRIADKILDPQLVPLIERFCAVSFQLDHEFINSKPDTFVDKDGKIWKQIG